MCCGSHCHSGFRGSEIFRRRRKRCRGVFGLEGVKGVPVCALVLRCSVETFGVRFGGLVSNCGLSPATQGYDLRVGVSGVEPKWLCEGIETGL